MILSNVFRMVEQIEEKIKQKAMVIMMLFYISQVQTCHGLCYLLFGPRGNVLTDTVNVIIVVITRGQNSRSKHGNPRAL